MAEGFAASRESILTVVLGILEKMDEEGTFDCEIGPDTWLVADLGLESIEVVVLGTEVQGRFGATLPFAEFLAEIGQREVRDLQVREFVEFVYRSLNGAA